MKMKIYQIDVDKNPAPAFLGYDKLLKLMGWTELDSSIYKLVFEADTEVDEYDKICDKLESIYVDFNLPKKEKLGYDGRSMSVSDIIELDGEFYYCDSIGFKQISFTPPVRMLRGFLVDVEHNVFTERTVADDPHELSNVIGCEYIEVAHRMICGKEYDIICDEESTFKEFPIPSAICNGNLDLVGNLFIVKGSDADGNFVSINDDDVKMLKNRIKQVIHAGKDSFTIRSVLIVDRKGRG